MKAVIIPDSFKGTIPSSRICAIIRSALLLRWPDAEILSVPVADGGEGTVDCFLEACGGKRISVTTGGPFGGKVESFYGIMDDGTAVIEMAASAGLPLVGDSPDPLRATTFGVGELMLHAIRGGCRKIILGLGGSATNDGGCGLACALGAVFKDAAGKSFVPAGGTLKDIHSIDITRIAGNLAGIPVTVMCDIENPLYGQRGAAFVYAPQKGADPVMVGKLDEGLRHLSAKIEECLGIDVSELPGGGAAGGLGAGMAAFCGAPLVRGIETVLDTVGFEALINGADLVFSGEGRIDSQSLSGKVIDGVARRTKKAGVPLVALVGDIGEGIEEAYDRGVTAIFSINTLAIPFSEARKRSEKDLAITIDNMLRFANIWKK